MKINDLTGKTFGTLNVLYFDEKKYNADTKLKKLGEINRVRRYYVCKCLLCGNELSVRGENLVSGNSKGCGCDKFTKIKNALKKQNDYIFDEKNNCYVFYASNTGSEFFVSKEDFEQVIEHCWYETSYGYLMTRLNRNKQIFLHRYLFFGETESENNIIIDHKNRNIKDYRRCNLRASTPSESIKNRGLLSSNTSGFTGVSYYKPGNKWRAWVTVDRKFISLGYYDKKEDAIKARLNGELMYYGEFAPSLA